MDAKTIVAKSFFLLGMLVSPHALAQNGTDSQVPSNCKVLTEEPEIETDTRVNRKMLRRYAGKTIKRIDIIVQDIFDESIEEENNAIYRFANRIQINTMDSVVKSQLLFKEGETLKPSKILESIRLLYGRNYILDVKIVFSEVCDDGLVLTVVTRDAWVIEPKISFGRKGGEDTGGFGLRDGNFLGTGSEIEVSYMETAERSKSIYQFRNSHLFGGRIDASVRYEDLSDGTNTQVAVSKPFYSLSTPWSVGVRGGEKSLIYKTRYKDEIINEFRQKESISSAFLGFSLYQDDVSVRRIRVGISDEEYLQEAIDETIRLPDDTSRKIHWVEYSKLTDVYEQFKNLSYIERVEDVAIGAEYQVRFGHGSINGDDELYDLNIKYSNGISYSDKHLWRMSFSSRLSYNASESLFQDSTADINSFYHYFLNGKNKWFVRAQYAMGENLSEWRELTLGEEVNMRGIPLAYQRGDRRYLVNIERRFYSNIHLFNLIRVGAVAFVDMGRAWGLAEYENNEHLRSVGAGLRIHASKTGDPAVLHLNVAQPISEDEKLKDYLVSLSVKKRF